MQCIAFYQYLKSKRGGTGPWKELKLQAAQRSSERTGNTKSLHKAISKMPGAEKLCIRTPHLEGEEVFLSLKRKADLPLGSEYDSHRPDKISVSRPHVETRSSKFQTDPLLLSPTTFQTMLQIPNINQHRRHQMVEPQVLKCITLLLYKNQPAMKVYRT